MIPILRTSVHIKYYRNINYGWALKLWSSVLSNIRALLFIYKMFPCLKDIKSKENRERIVRNCRWGTGVLHLWFVIYKTVSLHPFEFSTSSSTFNCKHFKLWLLRSVLMQHWRLYTYVVRVHLSSSHEATSSQCSAGFSLNSNYRSLGTSTKTNKKLGLGRAELRTYIPDKQWLWVVGFEWWGFRKGFKMNFVKER